MVNSLDFAPLVFWLRGTSVSSVMVVLCFGITSWRFVTLRSVAAILCWLSHELRLDPTYFCSLSHYCLTLTWSFAHSWLSGMSFRVSGMCWLFRRSVWRLFLVPSSVVAAQAAMLRSTRELPGFHHACFSWVVFEFVLAFVIARLHTFPVDLDFCPLVGALHIGAVACLCTRC